MQSINDFFSYLLHQKKYSINTVEAYKRDILDFTLYLETTYDNIPIIKADETIIRSWFAELMEKEIKPISIKRKKAAITSLYKYHMKMGDIDIIPSKNVNTPKISKRIPVFIPESKISSLFEIDFFLINDYEKLRNRMIIETFYATGIRVSELVSLSNKSFNFENKNLKVLGKRNKERIIPLNNLYIKMIIHYQNIKNKMFEETETDSSFFLTIKGKKIYRKLAYRIIFSYLSNTTTLNKKSPHIMRHTFATHLLNEGADINAIKDVLGHSSLAATQLYTHNTIEKLKRIYKQSHPKSKK